MMRILIVDDQNTIRQGLKALLESKPKLNIVGTASDGNSAIKQVEILRPDIVLMDIEMPKMSGIIATEKISRQFPATKILVLSGHENREYVVRALRAGALGYLLKDTLAENLEQAIYSVYQGQSRIESKLLKELVAETSLYREVLLAQDRSAALKTNLQQTSLKLNDHDHSDVFDLDHQNWRKTGDLKETQNGSLSTQNKIILKPVLKQFESEIIGKLDQDEDWFEINTDNSPNRKANRQPELSQEWVGNKPKFVQKQGRLPKFWRRGIMGLIAISALLTAIIFVYSRASKSSSRPVVNTQIVSKAIAAIGYLEPQGEAIKLSAPAFLEGTRVEGLLVKRGDKVEKGQVVAILDNRDRLEAALQQAQTEVIVAQSRLAQVKVGAKQGEIQAQNAKFQETKAELAGQIAAQTANIANLKAQLERQTNSQQATVARLKAESNNATKECQRDEFLLADGAISSAERDKICLQQATTQKQLQVAKVNLIKIKATLQQQIGEAQANLERTKASLANQISKAEASLNAVAKVRSVDVAVVQSELATAEAAVTKAQADLDLTFVKSPINGQILEINTWAGEIVDNAKGLVVMGNTTNMYVVAEVDETDIDRIRLGQRATISSDGITEKLIGTVDDIGWQISSKDISETDPVADADTRVAKVKIRLNPESSRQVTHLTNLKVNAMIDTSKQSQK